MSKAVIYARFSSSKQREESIEGQVRVCTDYADKHGLVVVDTYIDREISGKTDERPAFQQMISDAKAHRFDTLIVYKNDRFSRNRYDAAVYKRTLRLAGVDIKYAAEAIPEGPEGIILESMLEGFAEYYSAELAQKVRRGMHENALKCRTTGSTPLGYKIVDHQYVIDEKGAQTVRRIYEAVSEGVPFRALIEKLNSLGLKTSTGSKWNRSSFYRILTNEKYRGLYKFGDVEVENESLRIVPDELWYAVQGREKRKVKKATNFPLAGKVLFEGTPMRGTSGTSKSGITYYYYHAPKTATHGAYSFRKEELEDFVIRHTMEQLLAPDNLDVLYKELEAYQKNNDSNKVIEDRIKVIQKNIDNIVDAITAGGYIPSMTDRLKELEAERDELKAQLKPQIHYTKPQMKKMLEHFRDQPSEKVRQDVLAHFVDTVSFDGDVCDITYILGVRKLHLMVNHWSRNTNTFKIVVN